MRIPRVLSGIYHRSDTSPMAVLDEVLAGSGYYKEEPKRPCAYPGCEAWLSNYNEGNQCWCHPKKSKYDVGGGSGTPSENTRSRQPIQPSRDQILLKKPQRDNSPLVGAVLDLVSQEYFIARETLLAGGGIRNQLTVEARHIAMFLMRELNIPVAEITDIFRYDKQSVFYAIGNIRKTIGRNPVIAKVVRSIRKKLSSSQKGK